MTIVATNDVVQNVSLGATAMCVFARAYLEKNDGREGPELPLCMVLLPMVYHRRTASTIHRMRAESSLLRALQEEPQITIGLQRRVESLAGLSFQSLNVAVASSLVEWDPATPWPRVSPTQKSLPSDLLTNLGDVPVILGAAKRLGWWLTKEDVMSLYLRLGVMF